MRAENEYVACGVMESELLDDVKVRVDDESAPV